MGKPHPIELRERVVAFVEEGHTHRAAAAHFRVSPRFVNNMVILKRETGSLAAKRQGHGGVVGKLKDQGELILPKRVGPPLCLGKRRIKNGKQATHTGRDCLEVTAG